MLSLATEILLVDLSEHLVQAWIEAFADIAEVQARRADYFQWPATAMVSPANSFGFMDGGLDRAIRYELGDSIEAKVQAVISNKHHGELPVGVAEVIPTGHDDWPWLVVAPTMRVPEDVGRTLNAYLAFRAVLLAVKDHNACSGLSPITSIVVPGLGTGIGGLTPTCCAAQMVAALRSVKAGPEIPSPRSILSSHAELIETL